MIIIMDNSWTICQKHIKTHCQNISLSLPSKQQINHRDSEFFESPNDHSLSHACQSWLWSLCQSLAKWCMKCFVEKCTGDLTQKKWMRNCKLRRGAQMGPGACMQLYCTGAIGPLPEKNNKNERKRLCCFAQAALFLQKKFSETPAKLPPAQHVETHHILWVAVLSSDHWCNLCGNTATAVNISEW